ncbi:MAG: HEAT repeat domain-containing protein [Planctomycetota bacterium]
MRFTGILLVVACAAGAALAHNGEYHPPLPPPKIKGVPRPGTAEATPGPRPGEAVTPGPDDVKPNDPLPEPPVRPRAPRPGVVRDDARLTVAIWWEANRHRYLPGPPEMSTREELVSVLLDAVDSESHLVRGRAVIALGRAGGTRAFHRLLKAVNSKDLELRVSAATALGLLGDDTASPALKKLAADGASGVEARTFAVLALGLVGSADDAAFLREVVNEEWEPNIRTAAVLATGFHRDACAVNALGRILHDAHPLPSPDQSSLGDRPTRAGLVAAAAWALGRILTPRAYDYLAWAVDGKDPDAAASAAGALVRAPGTAGLPALRRGLRPDASTAVRQQVMVGLAASGDGAAIEAALAVLMSDREREGALGPFAALALGLTKDPAHTKRLIELVGNEEAYDDLRAAAALAIGVSGCRTAGPALAKTLGGVSRSAVLGAGTVALALLGHEAGAKLATKLLSESDLPGPRRNAVTALRILAPKGVEDLLAKELGDAYHVNREAALALARVDDRRAAAELMKKLADPNLYARRFAAHSLGELLARRSPDPLRELAGEMNVLSGSRVLKACLFLSNEYLYQLVRNF